MKKTNIYGFYSGGYLFDHMDLIAQANAMVELPQYSYHYTWKAKIEYMKQACEHPKTCKIKIKKSLFHKNRVKIIVTLGIEGLDYCKGTFVFVGKNTNYCVKRLTNKK